MPWSGGRAPQLLPPISTFKLPAAPTDVGSAVPAVTQWAATGLGVEVTLGEGLEVRPGTTPLALAVASIRVASVGAAVPVDGSEQPWDTRGLGTCW